ncbi:MAG: M48 family metalloprotease [Candidatus Microthrix sp.]|nr:M48 family metalloprotease [Candidatus Microthrix sp.]
MTHEQVAGSSEPVAFAVPGRPGRVVVSKGMLETLDSAERRVVYAHEHSHLRRHHHRFLHVADAAAAAVPLLEPLNRQVRFATERWADEDAVVEVGDRRLVARAVARAALASSASGVHPTPLGINGSGARARVEALMLPPGGVTAATLAWGSLGMVGLAVSVAGTTVQFHHLVAFVFHICGLH